MSTGGFAAAALPLALDLHNSGVMNRDFGRAVAEVTNGAEDLGIDFGEVGSSADSESGRAKLFAVESLEFMRKIHRNSRLVVQKKLNGEVERLFTGFD